MPRLMFQRPRRIEWEDLGPRYGRMAAEPFEKGYALTVGNSLRRVLLSVIPGAAITWVKVTGAGGTRLAGVREELPEILLNVKKVVVHTADEKPTTARISVTGPKAVTGADIQGVEVLTPEQPICTVEAGGKLAMELGIRVGRGYVSAERHAEPAPAGAVPLDAAFSPVQRVNYTVEMSRLGKITDYEKLLVEVWTDGSIAPDQALLRASRLLRDHFDLFTPAGAEEEDEEPAAEPVAPGEARTSS
jgi:DNA-directed RNA polymerase subunit alpha